jgi:hypothetical protein
MCCYVLVNIAAGCETTLNYTLTQLPVPSNRYLAGKLNDIAHGDLLDHNEPVWIKAYKEEVCTTLYDSYEVPVNADWSLTSTDEWYVSVPSDSSEVYFTLTGKVGGKECSVPVGKLASIPPEGKENIALNFTTLTWYVKEGASGNGGYTTPFGTVQDAVDHISGISSGAVSGETIHIKISGTVSGATTISASGASMIGGASSIILEGYDDSADIINVGPGTGLLIDVSSSLAVTFGQNLTLTGAANTGVYVQNGRFILDGGTISGNGGGVRIANGATFTMKNGSSIEGNTVSGGEHGGGVYIGSGATFTMEGGSSIKGNTVSGGGHSGGVYVASSAAFTMKNGSIEGNTVKDGGYSGGVYVASDATFTMEGGGIERNTVSGGGHGGGVYVASSAAFTMENSGSISNNVTDGHGGGVYITSGGIFNSSGSISGNTPNNLAMGN